MRRVRISTEYAGKWQRRLGCWLAWVCAPALKMWCGARTSVRNMRPQHNPQPDPESLIGSVIRNRARTIKSCCAMWPAWKGFVTTRWSATDWWWV